MWAPSRGIWQSLGYRLGYIVGTDESTGREGQEDLPVSEEKTEKNGKREMKKQKSEK